MWLQEILAFAPEEKVTEIGSLNAVYQGHDNEASPEILPKI